MTQHTEIKWHVIGKHANKAYEFILDEDGGTIALLPNEKGEVQSLANARFIVKACNNHEALVEALKTLIDTYWKNQGSDGKTCPHPAEFITCITPDDIPDYWRKAQTVLSNIEKDGE